MLRSESLVLLIILGSKYMGQRSMGRRQHTHTHTPLALSPFFRGAANQILPKINFHSKRVSATKAFLKTSSRDVFRKVFGNEIL